MAARIRAFPPSLHINVPFGLGLLVDRLAADAETRAAFFSRLEVIFFAGAAIDAELWSRLHAAVAAGPHGPGGAPSVLSGYGATEAGSTICVAHEEPGRPGEVGVPLPGHELKMAPVDGALECRFRGPNVSPGYLTKDGPAPMPLDEDGFLCTGDLVAALHEGRPELGLRFDGRIAEDFKLTTGTRVKVGSLRHALLEACAPHLADVAIAGEGRASLGAILFPRSGAAETADALREALATALAAHNQRHPGLSTAIARAVLADRPADADAGEINDKGHLVQRRTLKNRAAQVDALFAPTPPAGVIDLTVPATPETKEAHV
jgi:feruloyl-CoA synthase